ncbi:hypothetical protein DFH08DRAFT_799208 [Mycena albidolilacea]|uniref:Uncharacterized protein n=1 Tax=Mycena albidolilacea TaxID=1033008 RepID=A0AAD7AQ36_9AGAR|nr:hypothetical protein DFH08DRAFT_799208 [Mycena albidolilacea]
MAEENEICRGGGDGDTDRWKGGEKMEIHEVKGPFRRTHDPPWMVLNPPDLSFVLDIGVCSQVKILHSYVSATASGSAKQRVTWSGCEAEPRTSRKGCGCTRHINKEARYWYCMQVYMGSSLLCTLNSNLQAFEETTLHIMPSKQKSYMEEGSENRELTLTHLPAAALNLHPPPYQLHCSIGALLSSHFSPVGNTLDMKAQCWGEWASGGKRKKGDGSDQSTVLVFGSI